MEGLWWPPIMILPSTLEIFVKLHLTNLVHCWDFFLGGSQFFPFFQEELQGQWVPGTQSLPEASCYSLINQGAPWGKKQKTKKTPFLLLLPFPTSWNLFWDVSRLSFTYLLVAESPKGDSQFKAGACAGELSCLKLGPLYLSASQTLKMHQHQVP